MTQSPQKRSICLIIRRYDLSENPDFTKRIVDVSELTDYKNVKSYLQNLLGINEDKVIKVRNTEGILIPLTFLLDSEDEIFNIDITGISYADKHSAALLQDAYVDAVHQKIRTLESRIAQSELVLPQLEWRRQACMEDILNASLSKMIFLNKRFNELAPQFGTKPPVTMS